MFAKFKGALISAVGNFDAQGMGFLPGDRPFSPDSGKSSDPLLVLFWPEYMLTYVS